MRKLNVLLLLCIFLSSSVFAALGRQTYSKYYEILLSTASTVTVSSTTVTTLSDMARAGAERQFAISGTCDGTVFYQYGGSTTTVSAVGIPMEENAKLYKESNYFGDIHFQTDTYTATLRIIEITRK